MPRALVYFALASSLIANAWLIVESRSLRSEAKRPARSVSPPPEEPAARAARKNAEQPAIPTEPATEADFKALRIRLEAQGIPTDVIRSVIAALLQRNFQRRQAELLGQPNPDEYWRNPSPRPDVNAQLALQELGREQRRLLRATIGHDLDSDENARRRQFGGLPDAKVAQLTRILSDYADLEEQLFSDPANRGAGDNRARAELLAREKRADIERLLTPDELLNYDLRNSSAAHRLRGKLGQFAATEEEFRTLYPLFKATLEASGPVSPGSRVSVTEARRARENAERQLDEQLRRTLGDARYTELQEANDHLLQQTRAFTASLNLPPQVASEVIALQKEYSPKLTALDRDRDLTPNDRDALVSALGIEARDRLIRTLGPAGFEAYKRQGGGWLGAALNRAPPTPSPLPPR